MENEYRSAIHSSEYVNERAEYILETLGLHWEDLQGKHVLDLGAGNAELARAATQRGIDTIQSIDLNPSMQDPTVEKLDLYQKADAAALPFPDESFDLVVSHAAPPTLIDANNAPAIVAIVHEALRVLKPGGEFRFGPDFTLRTADPAYETPEHIEGIMKQYFPSAERTFIRTDGRDSHVDVYVFSLHKPLANETPPQYSTHQR